MLDIKVNPDEVIKGLEDIRDNQMPFAIAKALTKTAQAGQEASRKLEGQVFNTRNDWTVRNTKITPATKQTLTSEVYTDTSNRQTGAGDYLPRQEDGGEKVPVNGRQHLAVPTKFLRRMVGEHTPIPDWLRPKAMLEYADKQGKYTTRRGKQRGAPAAIKGMYFFKVRLKSGAWAILARYVSDPRDAAYPMYILVTRAHLRKRFPMEESVESIVQKTFETEFRQAFAEAHPFEL